MRSNPKASAHSTSPDNTLLRASWNALLADTQPSLIEKIGMPVRPICASTCSALPASLCTQEQNTWSTRSKSMRASSSTERIARPASDAALSRALNGTNGAMPTPATSTL
ncbi:hypothetical protein D3C73_1062540 [compost metagenome]